MKKVKLFATALIVMQAAWVQAQSDVQNTGILHISGGSDILYINGALTNAAGAALTNNGSLYVRNNLTNGQVSMAVGTGTLYLNGTSLQTVAGAQPFRTFNLVTDNTAGFTLNANLHVSGTHTFTNGVIATSATPNYLVYEAGSSYSGAADGRHVNGWVKKFGNTNFTFPVGNATYLRSVTLSGLTASSEFNARHNSITPNPTNVASPIVLVDTYEYWDIPRVSGGNAQVTLNWDNSKVPFPSFPLTEIRVVNLSGGLWTSRGGSATGNITTTGVITSNVVSSFGLFTFGSIDWFVPLQFLRFNAQRKQGYSQLEWATSREFNAQHFDIERSDDGTSFRKIGSTAAMNSSGTNQYQYADHLPLHGTAWYRIRSVDKDGQYKYSTIAVVTERNNNSQGMYVINNPAYQYIYLFSGADRAGNYDYSLINAAGQLMQKGKLTATAGGVNSISLGTAMAPGIYILDVRNNQHRFSQRVVVR